MTKAFANLAAIMGSFSLSSSASGLVSRELRSSLPQGVNVLTRYGQEWPEGRPLPPPPKKNKKLPSLTPGPSSCMTLLINPITLLQFPITLVQLPIALTLLNCFWINDKNYTYTLDCFWITSVIPLGTTPIKKKSWGIHFSANTCGACICTRANTGKYFRGVMFCTLAKFLREIMLGRIHVVPVFAPARIQENTPGELSMYWFCARV